MFAVVFIKFSFKHLTIWNYCMIFRRLLLSFLVIIISACSSTGGVQASAVQLEVAQKLILPQLKDQFEQDYRQSTDNKMIFFSHDMSSSKLVKKILKQQNSASMKEQSIQYVADISQMPSLIARFIALPKLRDLEYRVGLAREEQSLAFFPRKEKQATLLILNKGQVAKILYLSKPEDFSYELKDKL